MRHSFISWDCCYRNFFHTMFALSEQDFDPDRLEVIYVEQRTRAQSDEFNRRLGLPSLGDTAKSLENSLNVRVLYLGDARNVPFHWGRAVNLGIASADGDVISVMDGDLLVERDFVSRLDKEHSKDAGAIVNLHRRMVPAPIGVSRERWTQQQPTFAACLAACPDRDQALPTAVQNYGPLISARRAHWEAIGGYDEHKIWSTGLSRIGEDVTKRLEAHLDTASHLLPETVCVHPWHPVGFRRDTFAARRMLSLQGALIQWACRNSISSWKDRLQVTQRTYDENRRFVDAVLRSEVANPSVRPSRLTVAREWVSGIAAKLMNREFRQLQGEVGQALRRFATPNR
jgi:hypothetical protein